MEYFVAFYKKTTKKEFPIRKITIGMNNLVNQEFLSFDMFFDLAESGFLVIFPK